MTLYLNPSLSMFDVFFIAGNGNQLLPVLIGLEEGFQFLISWSLCEMRTRKFVSYLSKSKNNIAIEVGSNL